MDKYHVMLQSLPGIVELYNTLMTSSYQDVYKQFYTMRCHRCNVQLYVVNIAIVPIHVLILIAHSCYRGTITWHIVCTPK